MVKISDMLQLLLEICGQGFVFAFLRHCAGNVFPFIIS